MYEELNKILSSLINGDLSVLSPDNIIKVSNDAIALLSKDKFDQYDKMCAEMIISMSQIVYNNTDRSVLFLDDGVYDLLLEKYKEYDKNFQVGAPVINFNQGEDKTADYVQPMTFIDDPEEFKSKSLFYDDLIKFPKLESDLITNGYEKSC